MITIKKKKMARIVKNKRKIKQQKKKKWLEQ